MKEGERERDRKSIVKCRNGVYITAMMFYGCMCNVLPRSPTRFNVTGSCDARQAVPAEGLVSILKKRNDTVGDHPSQMQQKPAKRRVRFQEIDDNLDQGAHRPGSVSAVCQQGL